MNYASAPRADGYSSSRDCGGDHELESLAGLNWNRWRLWIGIGGAIASEYALDRKRPWHLHKYCDVPSAVTGQVRS